MRYDITTEFTQLTETTGTVQNISCFNAVEVSDKAQADTGILLAPLQKFSFADQTLYVRCAAQGGATISVVPFELAAEGGGLLVIQSAFTDISMDNGVISFLNSAGQVVKYFNLPEEIYLRSIGTTFVPDFAFSESAYPNSTNPNLDGKPVLVLHVKGDDLNNPYDTFYFVNMEDLVDVYLPADDSISIAGNSIAVNWAALTLDTVSSTVEGAMWLEDDV